MLMMPQCDETRPVCINGSRNYILAFNPTLHMTTNWRIDEKPILTRARKRPACDAEKGIASVPDTIQLMELGSLSIILQRLNKLDFIHCRQTSIGVLLSKMLVRCSTIITVSSRRTEVCLGAIYTASRK